MSEQPKRDPNLPEFFKIEDIKRDIEEMENGNAAWTSEWMNAALMSAWREGNLEGDASAYHGGLYKERNPFMTEREQKAYYE